jgi:hypothetical protein
LGMSYPPTTSFSSIMFNSINDCSFTFLQRIDINSFDWTSFEWKADKIPLDSESLHHQRNFLTLTLTNSCLWQLFG